MPEENRPASKESAPDPSHNYERSHPERESPSGKLGPNEPSDTNHADDNTNAVSNKSDNRKAITSSDGEMPTPQQPDHSMKDEEPLGSDLRPLEHTKAEARRHPKTDGEGGTPDALDKRS